MLILQQPKQCREKLTIPDGINVSEVIHRVITHDPLPQYVRLIRKYNPYLRYQPMIWIVTMFPSLGNKCACGCGKLLTGRRTKWATEDCALFGYYVWGTIIGRSNVARFILSCVYDCNYCMNCGQYASCDLDHIIPVYAGGGACWLSNFQFLCKDCHKEKTKLDRLIY